MIIPSPLQRKLLHCMLRATALLNKPKRGPIARELWRHRHKTLARLYHWDERRRRYGCLSLEAKRVMRDANLAITGMLVGVNDYWLPQVMSEAIEAADALGI